jgi:hypothetical protein
MDERETAEAIRRRHRWPAIDGFERSDAGDTFLLVSYPVA